MNTQRPISEKEDVGGLWGQLVCECTNGQVLGEEKLVICQRLKLFGVSYKNTSIADLFCTFYQFCVLISSPQNILYIIEKDGQM